MLKWHSSGNQHLHRHDTANKVPPETRINRFCWLRMNDRMWSHTWMCWKGNRGTDSLGIVWNIMKKMDTYIDIVTIIQFSKFQGLNEKEECHLFFALKYEGTQIWDKRSKQTGQITRDRRDTVLCAWIVYVWCSLHLYIVHVYS